MTIPPSSTEPTASTEPKYGEWQPIDGAPHNDGVDVLVASERLVTVAFWDDEEQAWFSAVNHDGYYHGRAYPTHWMPLPKSPNDGR